MPDAILNSDAALRSVEPTPKLVRAIKAALALDVPGNPNPVVAR